MNNLLTLFEKFGVINHGHFLLSSERHSDTYINKDSAYCIPNVFKEIVINIFYEQANFRYDVITGPAIAGAVLAAPISTLTGKIFVYPEKIDGFMKFRRGYDKVINRKRILLVEDIITTGNSVVKTIASIQICGGIPVGVISIWNRTGWKLPGIPVISLINKPVESWDKSECELCKKGVKLQDPKSL